MITRPREGERRRLDDDDDEPPPRPSWYKTLRGLGLLLGVVLVIAFMFSRGRGTNHEETQQKQPAAIGVTQAYTPVVVPEVRAEPPPPPAPVAQPQPGPPTNLLPPGVIGPNIRLQAHAPTRPAMVVYDVVAPPEKPKPPELTEPPHTGIHFATATIPGNKASPGIDDTYILWPGLLFMVLDTAISSNHPGPLLAHIAYPGVFSRKGASLMPPGTQIIGKYEPIGQGDERLQAVSTFAWTTGARPVVLKIAGAPFAEPDGSTGLTGEIRHRYLERFGGAILVDVGQAAMKIAQAAIAKEGNTYLSFNSTEGLAQQILRSQINIPPLFDKHAGDTIAIWMTDPADFSDSYQLVADKR